MDSHPRPSAALTWFLARKIEIRLPDDQSWTEILKIHASGITKHGEIDYEAIVKLAEVLYLLHSLQGY